MNREPEIAVAKPAPALDLSQSLRLSIVWLCATALVLAQNSLAASLSPESFGAIGDGVHDDSEAVQRAIDELPVNGTLWFAPQKTYRICQTLQLKDQITFATDSNKPATLRALQKDKLSDLISGRSVTDVSFHGVRFLNDHIPADESAGNVVGFSRNCGRLTFKQCHFGSTPQGKDGRGGRYYLRGLALEHENVCNVLVDECSFAWVKYGVLTNTNREDMKVARAKKTPLQQDIRILNCKFSSISGDAVEFNHPGSEGLASGFFITGCALDVPPGIQMEKSAVLTAAGFCIGVAGAHHVVIENNTLTGCRWQGIHVEDEAKYILVKSNRLEGPGAGKQQGSSLSANLIHVLDSDEVLIENNILRNAARTGICFQSGERGKHSSGMVIRDTVLDGGGHIGIFSQGGNSVRIESVVIRDYACGIKVYLEEGATSVENTRIENMSSTGLQTSLPTDRFARLRGLSFEGTAKSTDFAGPQTLLEPVLSPNR